MQGNTPINLVTNKDIEEYLFLRGQNLMRTLSVGLHSASLNPSVPIFDTDIEQSTDNNANL